MTSTVVVRHETWPCNQSLNFGEDVARWKGAGLDLAYMLNWILMLVTPPAALLGLAFIMGRDQAPR